ncbi:hypothetical protein [Algoriphagus algorifonticola]|uniref:hypothetical protein n=1 Tax=Algoriphagus algorifonticola TaxID=2593007 RepID=UPI0011A06268|nr:hypothetical protein [Algoriphagus algorifonticola]
MKIYRSFFKSKVPIVLVNYSNSNFKTAQIFNSISGVLLGGFDKVISYCFEDLEIEFVEKNQDHFQKSRGGGYWVWKPYVILKTLEKLEYGQYLFYSDSGSVFKRNIRRLISSINLDQDVISFELPYVEKAFTKQLVFQELNCESSQFQDSFQRLAGFILIKKSDLSVKLIEEWLSYSQNLIYIDDSHPSQGIDCFVEHRHDQSIFSLLVKRNNFKCYRDPSQFGNPLKDLYPDSKYPQLIYLHRAGKIGLRQFLSIIKNIVFNIPFTSIPKYKQSPKLITDDNS